jgi:hypothetical protein
MKSLFLFFMASTGNVMSSVSKQRRFRALGALLALLLGWATIPSSLAFGSAGDCRMACCLMHGAGGSEGEVCCVLNHGRDESRSGYLRAEVGAQCPANCAAPASSARFFPSGINREITRLISLSNSAHRLPQELELIHDPLRSSPAPTRAPPSLFV